MERRVALAKKGGMKWIGGLHILAPIKAKPNVMRMNHPLLRLATRVAYASRQLPRMAWYAGHLYVTI
jgi:hypothetical protein